MWGQRENGYTLTKRQINKVKGWEVNYYAPGNPWGSVIGFFPSIKDAKLCAINHKKQQA